MGSCRLHLTNGHKAEYTLQSSVFFQQLTYWYLTYLTQTMERI